MVNWTVYGAYFLGINTVNSLCNLVATEIVNKCNYKRLFWEKLKNLIQKESHFHTGHDNSEEPLRCKFFIKQERYIQRETLLKKTVIVMPRKQSRQPSRKRLWFNVVEFDKETGRPLWRNKKTKLEDKLPPCITDPTFTAMLDKLRKETEIALKMNTATADAGPCSMVWRNSKHTYKPHGPPKPPQQQLQQHYRSTPQYENQDRNNPKLVMQFQHFSPLTANTLNENEQKKQIQEFLKMKPMPFHNVPEVHNNSNRGCFTTDAFGVPDSDVLSNDWENTVRLHHIDFDSKSCMYDSNYDLNSDQKVPLTIF